MAISIIQNPVQQVLVDSKGDMFVATADNTVGRFQVGADGTVLTADSSTATGMNWIANANITNETIMGVY
jgi:hypothetical protein